MKVKIMHCRGHLITKKLPTDDEISKILEKYREDYSQEQEFSWDWYEIGGRYGGKIKINFNPENNKDNWYLFKDRNNKYFISQALNELKAKKEEILTALTIANFYINTTININKTFCLIPQGIIEYLIPFINTYN